MKGLTIRRKVVSKLFSGTVHFSFIQHVTVSVPLTDQQRSNGAFCPQMATSVYWADRSSLLPFKNSRSKQYSAYSFVLLDPQRRRPRCTQRLVSIAPDYSPETPPEITGHRRAHLK